MALIPKGRDSRGRQMWVLDYRPFGRSGPRLRKPFTGTRKEAQHILDDAKARKHRSAFGVAPDPRPLAEALEEYVKELGATSVPAHTRKVRHTIMEIVKASPGATTALFSNAWLKRYRIERLERVSPRTVNREVSEVSGFLSSEVEKGYLEANPCRTLKRLKEDRSPQRWARPGEYAKVWAIASPEVRDAMDVLVATGMRHGELVMLRAADLETGSVTLRDRKARGTEESYLVLAIGPVTWSLLSRRLAASYWPNLLSLTHCLYDLSDEAGIPRLNSKAMRHACACWLLAMGMPKDAIQRQLGHGSVTTTEKYAKWIRGFDWTREETELPDRTRTMFLESASSLRPSPPQYMQSMQGMEGVGKPGKTLSSRRLPRITGLGP